MDAYLKLEKEKLTHYSFLQIINLDQKTLFQVVTNCFIQIINLPLNETYLYGL